MSSDIEALLVTRIEELEAEIAVERARFEETIRPRETERERLQRMLNTYRGGERGGERHATPRPTARERRRRVVTYIRHNHSRENPCRTADIESLLGVTPLIAGTTLGALTRFGHIKGDKRHGYWIE